MRWQRFSMEWDHVCADAASTGEIGTIWSLNHKGQIEARTADPRLNPGAVGVTESSTRMRKSCEALRG